MTRFSGRAAALVLVVLLGSACGGRAANSAADQTALIDIQRALSTAWVDGDRATIERYIASDWTSTGPDGSRADRASVFRDVFERGAHKIRQVDIDQLDVRVFGDAAVVTGRTHGVGEFSGVRYDVWIRFTDTFVRRDGQWQAVASHSSLLPKG